MKKYFFKSYVFLKNSLKIALRGLDKEIQKKNVKSQVLLKNGIKIAVAGLDKEIQKKISNHIHLSKMTLKSL